MTLKTTSGPRAVALGILGVCLMATQAYAQVVESVGVRALGMGGAFVAVASDSTTTWWNPAGLPAGPFLDLSIAAATTDAGEVLPTRREQTTGIALLTPPLGLAYYRFRVTDIRPSDPTGADPGSREEGRAGVPIRSLSAGQLGVTLAHTLVSGLHVGTTLKYVRGTLNLGRGDGRLPADDLLDAGSELGGGDAGSEFDLDAGLLFISGAMRLGLVARNLLEPEFSAAGETMKLARQGRVGAAFDADAAGSVPLIVSVDADLSRVTTATGERRNIALGIEQWVWRRRIGVRGGGRFNTLGRKERTATAGVSVVARAGLFLEAYGAHGGSVDDRGWGAGVRVSF